MGEGCGKRAAGQSRDHMGAFLVHGIPRPSASERSSISGSSSSASLKGFLPLESTEARPSGVSPGSATTGIGSQFGIIEVQQPQVSVTSQNLLSQPMSSKGGSTNGRVEEPPAPSQRKQLSRIDSGVAIVQEQPQQQHLVQTGTDYDSTTTSDVASPRWHENDGGVASVVNSDPKANPESPSGPPLID